MNGYISRVQITNFRNFKKLDIDLKEKAVIVGENKVGKTNFIYALRLILDLNLPDSARQLTESDFWDGLESPMENKEEIEISIFFKGFESNVKLLAILSDYIISIDGDDPIAKITYKFAPRVNIGGGNESAYEFSIYGGDRITNIFGYQQRKFMPIHVLPALRDVENDLSNWKKSPLKPLIDRLSTIVKKEELELAAEEVNRAIEKVTSLNEVEMLRKSIEERLELMVGKYNSISPKLGFASTDAMKILKSLKLYILGKSERSLSEESLGICNVLYLTLLILELEKKEELEESAITIIAIEEPEAHIHPHLQRLVFRDFLKNNSSVILTTHSPHIASITDLRSIVSFKNCLEENSTVGNSLANISLSADEENDLNRYLDVTKAEILFAKKVILVEGDSELYIISSIANHENYLLDQKGITLCSVQGTNFAPYAKLLGKNALDTPFSVITDADPKEMDEDKIDHLGYKRALKLIENINSEAFSKLSELFNNKNWASFKTVMASEGIFLNSNTLETDLAEAGNTTEMVDVLRELGATEKTIEKFNSALAVKNTEDIIKIIERYGKGRFAQRLASRLTEEKIPQYIKDSIKYLE